jgi:GAF domain-containing protein/HAMP domain-containing protein
LVAVGFCVVLYLRTEAWQMIIAGGAILLGHLLALLALLLVGEGEVDLAGFALLAALAVIIITAELVWSHATPFLAAAGILFVIFSGGTLLPGKRLGWLVFLGGLGLSLVLINLLEPLQRFDIRQAPLIQLFLTIGSGLLAAALIWRAVLAYRRAKTIRARLLVVSIATVLLTAVAISAGAIVIGFRYGRQQAIDRLELVASLREVEIDDWISDIRHTLSGSLQQAPEHRYVEPEMANIVAALVDEPTDSDQHEEAYDFLRYNFGQWLKQTPAFDAVFFMNRDAEVLVSTDPAMEGQVMAEETYFNRGTVGTYVAPVEHDDSLGRATTYASRPVLGEYGSLLGVLAGRVDGSTLDKLMRMREQANLGNTGEAYMVGEDFRMLTNSRFGEAGTRVETKGVQKALEEEEDGAGTYVNYEGRSVIGVYRRLPDLNAVLVAEQSRAEAFRAVNRTAALNAGIALVSVVIAGSISLSIARDIGGPLSELAEVASDIAGGELERTALVERQDEIGTMANAFNTMTARLRGLIGQLEERVAERTRELKTRSAHLEASAEVGHVASTVLDAEDLIHTVVNLVQDRFDLYYVGLFLLDDTGGWAELRAGTGAAGRKMQAQGHRLMVGGDSMIGQCIARREARVALDVGEEAVRFDNPLLPKTRSEAALPLQSRGRRFGAITVQSEEGAAFDDDTVKVLQTLADQVAVALDNAYLFAEAGEALKAARRASDERSREAWADLLQSELDVGYHSDERGVMRVEGVWRPEMEEAVRAGRSVVFEEGNAAGDDGGAARSGGRPLAVPITVAGRVIGVLDTYKPAEAGPWTDEEIETLESLVEQMAVSLESARLYRETQTRAVREEMVADITSQLRASLDPDTILRTTVRELGRALGAEMASVEMRPSLEGGNGGTPPGRGASAKMGEE